MTYQQIQKAYWRTVFESVRATHVATGSFSPVGFLVSCLRERSDRPSEPVEMDVSDAVEAISGDPSWESEDTQEN